MEFTRASWLLVVSTMAWTKISSEGKFKEEPTPSQLERIGNLVFEN
jgi:hypothetical protein